MVKSSKNAIVKSPSNTDQGGGRQPGAHACKIAPSLPLLRPLQRALRATSRLQAVAWLRTGQQASNRATNRATEIASTAEAA